MFIISDTRLLPDGIVTTLVALEDDIQLSEYLRCRLLQEELEMLLQSCFELPSRSTVCLNRPAGLPGMGAPRGDGLQILVMRL